MQTSLDHAFAALADPVRRDILVALRRGERSAGDLAAPFAISQPAVSRHLKVLTRSGLVERRVAGNRRMFRLAPHRLEETCAFLDGLRAAMEANYARLDALLAEENTR